MAGEAEDNVVIPAKQEAAVNVTPSPAPKPEPTDKPVVPPTAEEQAAIDAKASEAKAAEEAAAAEAAKETEQDDEAGDWDGEYHQFEDPAAKSVVDLLNGAGVNAREANSYFAKALQTGKFDDIDWAAIEAKIGPAQTNLAKIGVKDYHDRQSSKNNATNEAAYEIVGSKENWQKVASWVLKAEKADPSRREEFNELRRGIDMGGRYAKQAIKDFKELYEADPKNSGLGGSKVQEGSQRQKTGIVGISRAEYVKELQKHGDNIKPDVYADLQARRAAGRQAGL